LLTPTLSVQTGVLGVSERRRLDRSKATARMTGVTELVDLPDGYSELLAAVKADVTATKLRAARAANNEMLGLYWRVGRLVLERQDRQGWGSGVVSRLSSDLRREFPDQRGWGSSNLASMRRFAATWPDAAILQSSVGKLPWGHVVTLLNRLEVAGDRDWYAEQAASNGWSGKVLEHHIATDLRRRISSAPTNFDTQLTEADSDLASELVRDPYVFDFLNLTARASERDVEQAMMNRLQETLLELGSGFAFVGRQVRLAIDGDEFFLDLLLFHVVQLRYVVVELKVDRFRPEHAGQLQFYVAVVDDTIRKPEIHAPTIGILLCASRNEAVVRYALGASTAAMAVSTVSYENLPASEQAALPSADVIEAVALSVTATGAVDPPAATGPAY